MGGFQSHSGINMPPSALKVNSLQNLHPTVTPEDMLLAWLLPGRVRKVPDVGLQAVLFDLDGVLVDTAEHHYCAWQQLADELGLPFDRQANEAFRGVSRMDCLERLLGRHARDFALEEKRLLAERKNGIYLQRIELLSPRDLVPGARTLAMHLRACGVAMAVVSASKNARRVIEKLGIIEWFDTIIDGHADCRPKPDAAPFLMAAHQLQVKPVQCVVIEDAEAGIRAGKQGGMKTIAIAAAESRTAELADSSVLSIKSVTVPMMMKLLRSSAMPQQDSERLRVSAQVA